MVSRPGIVNGLRLAGLAAFESLGSVSDNGIQFLVVLIFIPNFSQDRTRDERPVPGGWIVVGGASRMRNRSGIEKKKAKAIDFFRGLIILFS